ncbi:MAG: beta-N-acetylhexosaminidase [Bacteroidetes bacterium]|nr:beta-N-acetylhexosaminidase [Bacteroidota bacterium]
MKTAPFFILIFLFVISSCCRYETNDVMIIPQPQQIEISNSAFVFDSGVEINYPNNEEIAVQATYFSELVFNSFGLKLETKQIEDNNSHRGIFIKLNSGNEDSGNEGYSLIIEKKYIDLLAFYKFNTFHWHLTEDQGWRIEIKKYPKLAEISSMRKETLLGHYGDKPHKFDGKPYGGYYTQDEVREIVVYASDRQITVIPEIEMPGHSLAALAAYPELGCTGGPYEVATRWGVFEDIYCTKEETFEFLENVLLEVMELFPSKYIHIGGDEAPKSRWKECSTCQAVIVREGLRDEHELQSYFIQRMEKFLNSHGRRIIGWDEILEGGLAPNATVMSWRGTEGGIAAARQDHDAIMTPGSHCYFDHYHANRELEPLAIGGFTTLEKVYSYEPVADSLTSEEANHIMGAQGNVWTEYMETPEYVEYMVL